MFTTKKTIFDDDIKSFVKIDIKPNEKKCPHVAIEFPVELFIDLYKSNEDSEYFKDVPKSILEGVLSRVVGYANFPMDKYPEGLEKFSEKFKIFDSFDVGSSSEKEPEKQKFVSLFKENLCSNCNVAEKLFKNFLEKIKDTGRPMLFLYNVVDHMLIKNFMRLQSYQFFFYAKPKAILKGKKIATYFKIFSTKDEDVLSKLLF